MNLIDWQTTKHKFKEDKKKKFAGNMKFSGH